MFTKKCLTASAMLLGVAACSAHAEVVTNGGFDAPDFSGDDNGSFDFADWVESGDVRGDEDSSGQVPGANPNQVVRFGNNTASIYQDLGVTWASTDAYDLTLNASETWWRTGSAGDAIVVRLLQTNNTELWNSGTINLDGLHTGLSMPAWTAGQTFNYTIDASAFTAGTEGQELRLEIARVGGVSYIDNVSLVVPEPSSLALLGLGSLALARRRHG